MAKINLLLMLIDLADVKFLLVIVASDDFLLCLVYVNT